MLAGNVWAHLRLVARIVGDLLAVGDPQRTRGTVTVLVLLAFGLTAMASAVLG